MIQFLVWIWREARKENNQSVSVYNHLMLHRCYKAKQINLFVKLELPIVFQLSHQLNINLKFI